MTMSNHGGSRPVMTATVDRLELTEGTALRDVMTALVPMDPEQGRIEDGLLPASLFRAIYFDNRANEVVLTGQEAVGTASHLPVDLANRTSSGSAPACTDLPRARRCSRPVPW